MTEQNSTPNGQIADLAIIGAGPAGMTAAIYALRSGLSVLMFERLACGGQLAQTEHIDNYPGFPEGVGGFDLALSIQQQAERFGVQTILDDVTSVDLSERPFALMTSSASYRARSIIVATGTRPRKLGLPEEEALIGRGISYCATCDGNFFRNCDVVVVGGGNTAVADAIYLSRLASSVRLVHRRDTLRAAQVGQNALKSIENLSFVWKSVIVGLESESGMLSGVRVRSLDDEREEVLPCAGLFVAIGTQPNTEFLQGALKLADDGSIVCDSRGATSAPGVFAAGDVCDKELRQVVTAVSDGAVAAEAAADFLVSADADATSAKIQNRA